MRRKTTIGLTQRIDLLGQPWGIGIMPSETYLVKVLSVEPANLIGLWLQNESDGLISHDYSGHAHHGAYTGVTLGQPGVPGMGYTSPYFDGLNDYNDIYSAGLANDNLLLNPGFETAGAGGADIWANWMESAGDGALANEVVIVHEGVDAAKMTSGATSNTHVYQDFVVVPGTRYRFRFWARGDGINAGHYRVWDNSNGADIVGATSTGITGAAYEMVTREFTAPAGCVSVRVYFYCPPVNGGIAYFDASEVRRMDGFLGDEGTILAWAKVANAGVWTDGTKRDIANVYVNGDNYVSIHRSTVDARLNLYYKAGGVAEALTMTPLADVDFMPLAITWNKSGDAVKIYKDGAQVGATATGLGVWVGNLSVGNTTIGASSTIPADVWSGNIGPVALWNQALTADQIAYLSTV